MNSFYLLALANEVSGQDQQCFFLIKMIGLKWIDNQMQELHN